MNLLTKIQNWGDCHHPQWLDYFRIALGLTLIYNGVAFASHLHAFTVLMKDNTLSTAISISLAAHLIIAFHIIGGILVTLGTHTRLFCLLNLFAVVAGIIFVSLQQHIFMPYSLLWFSAIVIISLICFIIEGDGVLSVENESNVTH